MFSILTKARRFHWCFNDDLLIWFLLLHLKPLQKLPFFSVNELNSFNMASMNLIRWKLCKGKAIYRFWEAVKVNQYFDVRNTFRTRCLQVNFLRQKRKHMIRRKHSWEKSAKIFCPRIMATPLNLFSLILNSSKIQKKPQITNKERIKSAENAPVHNHRRVSTTL